MAASSHLLPVLIGLVLAFSPPVEACDSSDKAALFNIKAAFSNPAEFSSWTDDTNCCSWKGVSCNKFIGDRVHILSFYNNNSGTLEGLSGPLPDALGDLPFLTFILFGNHPGIVSPLPPSLTRLRYLSSFSLRQTSLSGSIPPFLSQIHSLKLLDLSFNKFTGFIPPELSALPNLNALYLEGNQLVGSIPSSFGSFTKSPPPGLFLSQNMLSGDIPAEFGAADWVTVDLSHNELSGGANALFGANKALLSLDLSFNRFEFDLSPISFPINMTNLILNDNKIMGSIPVQINRLISLVKFNVSNNRLCGIIPAGPVTDKFDDTNFIGNKCLCRSQDSCF
ncbi:Polygalacturonase inhibitor 2 [Platanthera zijinensis]|uniref:Polygalacturonase inhibitor 2 n=1 Tax=Platanthera zijinensis TaxID=2320716 RepID=A0AAP0FWE0_9ASPA